MTAEVHEAQPQPNTKPEIKFPSLRSVEPEPDSEYTLPLEDENEHALLPKQKVSKLERERDDLMQDLDDLKRLFFERVMAPHCIDASGDITGIPRGDTDAYQQPFVQKQTIQRRLEAIAEELANIELETDDNDTADTDKVTAIGQGAIHAVGRQSC